VSCCCLAPWFQVTLVTFPNPLPEVIGMPQDPSQPAGLDGGVMLINLPAMRESYEELKVKAGQAPGT
jgi:hypothetical protein